MLLNLKAQTEVLRRQYVDETSRTPLLLNTSVFATVSACIVSAITFITASILGNQDPAHDPLLYTGVASASVLFILRILAEFKNSILNIPLPFTKEANIKRELNKINHVIDKI